MNPDFDKPLLVFEQQQFSTADEMIRKMLEQTINALKEANQMVRKPAPLSHLILGMECGGSDGVSGISANPAVGRGADYISAWGGGVMLSGVPELVGAEQNPVDRRGQDNLEEKCLIGKKSEQ